MMYLIQFSPEELAIPLQELYVNDSGFAENLAPMRELLDIIESKFGKEIDFNCFKERLPSIAMRTRTFEFQKANDIENLDDDDYQYARDMRKCRKKKRFDNVGKFLSKFFPQDSNSVVIDFDMLPEDILFTATLATFRIYTKLLGGTSFNMHVSTTEKKLYLTRPPRPVLSSMGLSKYVRSKQTITRPAPLVGMVGNFKKYEDITWLMPRVDVPGVLIRLGSKVVHVKGDDIFSSCPDHFLFTGSKSRHPDKWTVNTKTGNTYCFTEARGDNLFFTVYRLLNIGNEGHNQISPEAVERFLAGEDVT
jgi:hypothetical protein